MEITPDELRKLILREYCEWRDDPETRLSGQFTEREAFEAGWCIAVNQIENRCSELTQYMGEKK